MLKKIILSLLLISSIALAGQFPVNSIEYGISLKTDKFKNGISDVEAYQEKLFDTISLSRLDDDNIELDKNREVSYWDTKDRLLRKQKIIVRLRGKKDKWTITLKHRGASQEAAENWDISTDYKVKTKTEIDRYINKDAYSRSLKVKIKDNKLSTELLLKIFPDLKKYGLTKTSSIEKVNSFTAHSVSYEIGKYRFGKKKAPKKTTTSNFDLELWSCSNGKLVAAEISWKIRNKGINNDQAKEKAYDLLKALSSDSEWADPEPKSKTSIAYNPQNPCQ